MKRNIIVLLFILFIIVIFSFTKQRIFYVETIETNLQPEALWNLVTVSIENSKSTELWPNEYEDVQSTQMKPGNTIYTVYKTPFGNFPQTYTISDIRFGIIEYQSGPKHSLKGKGIISVIPRKEGSALSWSVDYSFSTLNPAGWYAKLIFVPSFFSSLKANLSKINQQESTR